MQMQLLPLMIQEVRDGEMSPVPVQETGQQTQSSPQHGGAPVMAVPTGDSHPIACPSENAGFPLSG